MKLIAMVLVSVVVPWLLVVWARGVGGERAGSFRCCGVRHFATFRDGWATCPGCGAEHPHVCEHKRLRHWGGRRFAHLHGRHTVGVDCLDCGGRNIDARIL